MDAMTPDRELRGTADRRAARGCGISQYPVLCRILSALTATTLLMLAVAGILAFLVVRVVELRVDSIVGPRGQVGDIRVRPHEIVLTDVVLPGTAGQAPTRAERVVLVPRWREFLTHQAVFERVLVRGYDMEVLRDGEGTLHVAPSLARALAIARGEDGQPRPAWAGRVVLTDGVMRYRDQTVSKNGHEMVFEQARIELTPLAVPAGDERMDVRFEGVTAAGPEGQRGMAALVGWVRGKGQDADLRLAVRHMPAAQVAPYLQLSQSAPITGGLIDLDMRTDVRNHALQANGTLALTKVRFGDEGSIFALPRQAVLSAMADRNDTVRFDFTVKGSLDDPKFALQQSLPQRVAGGFARAVGVSAEGASEGFTGAVKEMGKAFTNLW
ncbi:DUF748 domain-containing protein [Pseudomonadota bacterium AL_CKDN230030165-1A_HGKHYDSX7]